MLIITITQNGGQIGPARRKLSSTNGNAAKSTNRNAALQPRQPIETQLRRPIETQLPSLISRAIDT